MSRYDFACAAVGVTEGVADVVLTATGKGQRMGPEYWAQLPVLFEQLDADEEVRVVLLRTAAPNFSYGLDLAAMSGELAELTDPGAHATVRTRFLQTVKKMQRTHNAVAACRKPVIAAVQGWCIGGGVDLITACDLRLAAENAKFSVREVKLAIVPDVGTLARLPAIIGQGATRELALTGDDFDAARALKLGLVSEVFDSAEGSRVVFENVIRGKGRMRFLAPIMIPLIRRTFIKPQFRALKKQLDQSASVPVATG